MPPVYGREFVLSANVSLAPLCSVYRYDIAACSPKPGERLCVCVCMCVCVCARVCVKLILEIWSVYGTVHVRDAVVLTISFVKIHVCYWIHGICMMHRRTRLMNHNTLPVGTQPRVSSKSV